MNKNALLIQLSESNRTKVGKQDFALQSRPQKIFSAIWALESEVNNGGFAQYFLNSSAETASFVAEALDAVGAPTTAEICRRAVQAAFPAGLPQSGNEIRSAATGFSAATRKELEALDREFFAYPHDLTELLFRHVARHPEEFGELPELLR
jgi:hypothetical protein